MWRLLKQEIDMNIVVKPNDVWLKTALLAIQRGYRVARTDRPGTRCIASQHKLTTSLLRRQKWSRLI